MSGPFLHEERKPGLTVVVLELRYDNYPSLLVTFRNDQQGIRNRLVESTRNDLGHYGGVDGEVSRTVPHVRVVHLLRGRLEAGAPKPRQSGVR